ncbi:MAG: Na+ dependent nucleoside transporter [Bacteroidetes bacterium]|jgi:CNT family concentrative nucleoside transporter|nr:Na+ dependent nucleoside transporter [Bacteroidota bacterium]MDF1863784.1 nucleoside transporter C-terminal domain-containing protein [Saprospiraceae bacterium]
MEDIFRGLLGLIVMLLFCYILSSDRKNIDWRLVGGGVVLQLVLGILILEVSFIYNIFQWIADRFVDLLNYTENGASFVFGSWPDNAWLGENINLAAPPGSEYAFNPTADPTSVTFFKVGFMFAFKVLPTIVFFAAFSAILYYLGILQKIIFVFAWIMSKAMRLSGAESIAAAANVFIGQTEAPLVVKPYLENMTKSEIMCLMTGGMATIAGGVFALFVALLGDEYAIHFLTASIISAPAAIVAAKMLYPETDPEKINRDVTVPKDKLGSNLLDAISLGTTDGVKLAVNVGAMLLVFIALLAFVNGLLFWAGDILNINESIAQATNGSYNGLNLEYMLGLLFAPIAWILGVPSEDIMMVGQLLGKKTAINEVIAYVDLSIFQASPETALHPKSAIIATYALCGFANFSSIGIQIGGISAIAPSQRLTLTQFGIKSLIGGTIACFMTAAIAGMLI